MRRSWHRGMSHRKRKSYTKCFDIEGVADTFDSKIENFIRTKYESKRWVMDGGIPDPSTLDVEDDDMVGGSGTKFAIYGY